MFIAAQQLIFHIFFVGSFTAFERYSRGPRPKRTFRMHCTMWSASVHAVVQEWRGPRKWWKIFDRIPKWCLSTHDSRSAHKYYILSGIAKGTCIIHSHCFSWWNTRSKICMLLGVSAVRECHLKECHLKSKSLLFYFRWRWNLLMHRNESSGIRGDVCRAHCAQR